MKLIDWLSVLMAHLIRHKKTIDAVHDRVLVSDIHSMHTYVVAMLWGFSKEYFEQYGEPIPRPILEAKLADHVSDGAVLDVTTDELVDFVDWVYSIPEEDFNYEEAISYTRKLLEETRVHNRVRDAMLAGIGDMDSLLSSLQTGIDDTKIGSSDIINPMDHIEGFLGGMKPTPLGGAEVNYFNVLCQGGLRPGEVAVVLGPSGGFKTTMALDICCAMANASEYAMYLSYEQSYGGGDLPIRIAARLTGIDKTRLESVKPQDLTLDEQKALIDAKQKAQYLQFLDRSTRCVDSLSSIAEHIRTADRKGRKPKLVVIDQLLTWLERWPDVNQDTIRTTARDIMAPLKNDIAAKYGVSFLVLHQVTAALGSGSSTRVPHHTDSQECKGICNWVDFGIAMGNLDTKYNVFWISASKTRRGSAVKLLIRPDGEHCHLQTCGDVTVTREGQFRNAGGVNKITPNMTGEDKRNAHKPQLRAGDL